MNTRVEGRKVEAAVEPRQLEFLRRKDRERGFSRLSVLRREPVLSRALSSYLPRCSPLGGKRIELSSQPPPTAEPEDTSGRSRQGSNTEREGFRREEGRKERAEGERQSGWRGKFGGEEKQKKRKKKRKGRREEKRRRGPVTGSRRARSRVARGLLHGLSRCRSRGSRSLLSSAGLAEPARRARGEHLPP